MKFSPQAILPMVLSLLAAAATTTVVQAQHFSPYHNKKNSNSNMFLSDEEAANLQDLTLTPEQIQAIKETPLGSVIFKVLDEKDAATTTTTFVEASSSSSSSTSSGAGRHRRTQVRRSKTSKPSAAPSEAPSERPSVCDQLRDYTNWVISELFIVPPIPYELLNEICIEFKYVVLPNVPNFGCTFGYIPTVGFTSGDLHFYKKHFKSGNFFGEDIPKEAIYLFHAFDNLCECHDGFDLDCSTKIPRTGDEFAVDLTGSSEEEQWTEYCRFAGAWNGSFDVEDIHVSEEVEECGCYFIAQAKEKVDSCPGVDLGFLSFLAPTMSPTLYPTLSPTISPTFSSGPTTL